MSVKTRSNYGGKQGPGGGRASKTQNRRWWPSRPDRSKASPEFLKTWGSRPEGSR